MAGDRLELAQRFSLDHPQEAAEVIGLLPRAAGTGFLKQLEPDTTVTLLNAMLPPAAAAHLSEMSSDEAAALIREMAPQRAASVIRLLPAGLRRQALDAQSAVRRSQVQFYLRQAKGIVGAWIESDVITARAGEALESLKSKFSHYKGSVPLVYMVDAEQTVLGTVNAADLVIHDPDRPISSLVKPLPALLRARTPIEIAVTDPAWRKSDILPVVETGGDFLGVVRYATLRHAVDDLSDDPAPEMTGAAAFGLADAWFLGLSDLLSAPMGRGPVETADPTLHESDPS